MLPAPSTSTPRRAGPRRRLDLLVTFLSLVVAVELTWFLGHTPVRLVTEGQADIVLQGDKAIDGEQSGQLVPGPQPPHMAHGEGRDSDEPVPGVPVPGVPVQGVPVQGVPVQGVPVPGHGGQPAGPGRPDQPAVGVPARPTRVQATATRPPAVPGSQDPYHRMLTGIILLDARHPLDKAQARQLLDAVRAREALNGNDVAEAAHTVLDALGPDQRAFLTHARDARVRQRKLPSAPELLPRQIARWLEMTEKRAR